VCPTCGRWNLPDRDISDSLVHECSWQFSRDQQALTVDGVGHVRIGTLRLTKLGVTQSETRLSERRLSMVRARHTRTGHLGMVIALVSLAVIGGTMRLLGQPYGAYVGAAAFFVGMTTVGWIQRKRRMFIHGDGPDLLHATRGDAARSYLVAAGSRWWIRIETVLDHQDLGGDAALSALARLLTLFPPVTSAQAVREASAILHHPQGVDAAICEMIRAGMPRPDATDGRDWPCERSLRALSGSQRLALEMIAAEHQERQMLVRDVSVIKEQYEEARTIAAIVDREFPDS